MKKSFVFVVIVALLSLFGSKIDASVNTKMNDYNKKFILTLTDTEKAKNWCRYMMPRSDSENREFFRQALVDLNNGNIRYSIDTPTGLHINVVRAFAAAWEKQVMVENAKNWCRYMMPRSDSENREFFRQALVDLTNGNIRYSIDTSTGLHIDVVRAFAAAWNEL
jgi:hypothetical protein